MQKFLQFYAPFTSASMPLKFQRIEILVPLGFQAGLAAAFAIPFFVHLSWLFGLLMFAVFFVLIRTLVCAIAYALSEPTAEGRYMSPSVSSAAGFVYLAIFLLCFAAYILFLHLIGLVQ